LKITSTFKGSNALTIDDIEIMVIIVDEKLMINHHHDKKLANVTVTGEIRFSPQELHQMNTSEKRLFKLKCELWGQDMIAKDKLYTFNPLKYYPGVSQNISETFTFKEILSEGVLDEDVGKHEVYAKLILTNLSTGNQVIDKTNTVSLGKSKEYAKLILTNLSTGILYCVTHFTNHFLYI
jgi:hypothetical protein